MAYQAIQAYRTADGVLLETEIEAIHADIGTALDLKHLDKKVVAHLLCTNAAVLVPLLQRVISIQQAGRYDTPAPARNEFGGDNIDPSFTPIKPATGLAKFDTDMPEQLDANFWNSVGGLQATTSEQVRNVTWLAGYEAFKAGKDKAENPHDVLSIDERPDYIAWNYGFEYGRREAEAIGEEPENGDAASRSRQLPEYEFLRARSDVEAQGAGAAEDDWMRNDGGTSDNPCASKSKAYDLWQDGYSETMRRLDAANAS